MLLWQLLYTSVKPETKSCKILQQNPAIKAALKNNLNDVQDSENEKAY